MTTTADWLTATAIALYYYFLVIARFSLPNNMKPFERKPIRNDP
jgi:hypothetical protein